MFFSPIVRAVLIADITLVLSLGRSCQGSRAGKPMIIIGHHLQARGSIPVSVNFHTDGLCFIFHLFIQFGLEWHFTWLSRLCPLTDVEIFCRALPFITQPPFELMTLICSVLFLFCLSSNFTVRLSLGTVSILFLAIVSSITSCVLFFPLSMD